MQAVEFISKVIAYLMILSIGCLVYLISFVL